MRYRNQQTPPKIPSKISVRVLRETFPKPDQNTQIQFTINEQKKQRYPACHIQTQQSIDSSPYLQQQPHFDATVSPKRRRHKIFDRKHKHSASRQQNIAKQRNQDSRSHQMRQYSPTFNVINSKTHHKHRPDEEHFNNFCGQQTLKNVSSLHRPPTVKDLSPSKQLPIGDHLAHTLSSNILHSDSHQHSSPSKEFEFGVEQQRKRERSRQILERSPDKVELQLVKKIERLQKSQQKNERQIEKLNERISLYYSRAQESQNSVLMELEKSSRRILSKQKQIQDNLITIRDLQNKNQRKNQLLDHLRLEMERSKRVQQLSLQNQKLYQSLARSKTKMTHDQTYLEHSKFSKHQRSAQNNQSYTQPYNFLSPTQFQTGRSPERNIKQNNFIMEQIRQEQRKERYFSNSISALYSPLEQGIYDYDDRNDTINQLLSPLCINPDYV